MAAGVKDVIAPRALHRFQLALNLVICNDLAAEYAFPSAARTAPQPAGPHGRQTALANEFSCPGAQRRVRIGRHIIVISSTVSPSDQFYALKCAMRTRAATAAESDGILACILAAISGGRTSAMDRGCVKTRRAAYRGLASLGVSLSNVSPHHRGSRPKRLPSFVVQCVTQCSITGLMGWS